MSGLEDPGEGAALTLRVWVPLGVAAYSDEASFRVAEFIIKSANDAAADGWPDLELIDVEWM